MYARLREHSPVHRSVILGSWIISRYDDVLAVARDHERFSNDPRCRNATASVLPPAPDDYSILLVDPTEHTRLRKFAARAFTRPKLMELKPTIEALANDIVDRAVKRAEVEWMAEVAQPMAMRVMLRMLGIAGEEETRWHQWSTERARLLEMIATRAERKTAHLTGESMTEYFRERHAERARGDADDAISLLAREAARGGVHPRAGGEKGFLQRFERRQRRAFPACGEHCLGGTTPALPLGSSPRAGNTAWAEPHPLCRSIHPRVRGMNLSSYTLS